MHPALKIVPNPASSKPGPRTEEGKQRSSLNALRHGLTGRTALLPTEDAALYQAFLIEYLADLNPQTAVERHLAQTIADHQWRLNRLCAIEDGLLIIGAPPAELQPETGVPAADHILNNARAFRDHARAFATLSIYEQRIHRSMEKCRREFKQLQTENRTRHEQEMEDAIRLQRYDEMERLDFDPAADGFVFATDEIDTARDQSNRRGNAKRAEHRGFDRDKFYRECYRMEAPPIPGHASSDDSDSPELD